jgi:hypothetical protein
MPARIGRATDEIWRWNQALFLPRCTDLPCLAQQLSAFSIDPMLLAAFIAHRSRVVFPTVSAVSLASAS